MELPRIGCRLACALLLACCDCPDLPWLAIAITLSDPSGRAVTDAVVTCTSGTQTHTDAGAPTNRGRYLCAGSAGTYEVTITRGGVLVEHGVVVVPQDGSSSCYRHCRGFPCVIDMEGELHCDLSVAWEGDPCDEGAACSGDGASRLHCVDGRMTVDATCPGPLHCHGIEEIICDGMQPAP